MLPAPNLTQIAHQSQELAKTSKDQRLGLVFQTVSTVCVAVLGVGAAVHVLRQMLRDPHHHPVDRHDHPEPDRHAGRHRRPVEHADEDDGPMVRAVRRRSHHTHHRG